jgi:hypothetical protein
MPGTFSSLSIFAYDLDDRGEPVQAWETVVGETEAEAIGEAKEAAGHHAGVLGCGEMAVPQSEKKATPSSSSG